MEKSNHRVLLALIVIIIIAICGSVGYFMLDKSGMKLSGNSTTSLKQDNWNIKITASEKEISNSVVNLINVDKTNIKVLGTLTDKTSIISYNLKIDNTGSIDAYLYSVVSDNSDIDVKVLDGENELSSNKILESNKSMNAVLLIKSNKEEAIDFDINIKLVFNQYNE